MFRVTESICREGDGEGSGVATVPVDDAGLCALGRQFAQIGRRNGFDYFLVSTFPKADKPEFAANSVFCNWPSALRDRYDASESFAASRLVTRLKQKILPFLTKDCVFASGQERADDIELAADFQECGLVNNLAFALHDAELAHYLIVFSGERGTLDRQETASLYFDCLEALDICSGRIGHKDGPREKLSARELECLRWSAAGKSSDEIAIILSISSHTVVSYLKSAMRKLDSVNRMQAVARACRFRLL